MIRRWTTFRPSGVFTSKFEVRILEETKVHSMFPCFTFLCFFHSFCLCGSKKMNRKDSKK